MPWDSVSNGVRMQSSCHLQQAGQTCALYNLTTLQTSHFTLHRPFFCKLAPALQLLFTTVTAPPRWHVVHRERPNVLAIPMAMRGAGRAYPIQLALPTGKIIDTLFGIPARFTVLCSKAWLDLFASEQNRTFDNQSPTGTNPAAWTLREHSTRRRIDRDGSRIVRWIRRTVTLGGGQGLQAKTRAIPEALYLISQSSEESPNLHKNSNPKDEGARMETLETKKVLHYATHCKCTQGSKPERLVFQRTWGFIGLE